MRWLRGETPDSSFDRLLNAFRGSSLKTRLMLGLIPPVVIIMIITITIDDNNNNNNNINNNEHNDEL